MSGVFCTKFGSGAGKLTRCRRNKVWGRHKMIYIIKKNLKADRLRPGADHRAVMEAVNDAVESGEASPKEAWDRVRDATGTDHKAAHVDCNID